MNKVVVVVGPTAVGKSAVGIHLARQFQGEIINGDSVSVYKELNIGSAKTMPDQQEGIPHHLIDYKEVEEDYSVADFQTDGRKAIEDITARGKLPIVGGGTGLYVKALLYDYNFLAEAGDHSETYEDVSTGDLYQRLLEIDPEATEKIHPNNRKRIIRALQIAQSGTLKSDIEKAQQHTMIYDAKVIGLTMDRSLLNKRIDLRVDMMIEDGLTEEVISLFEKYGYEHHCFSAIGYKEYIDYFLGNKSLEETVELIKIHTRQFAKRQFTWFRHQMPIEWFDVNEEDCKEKICKEIEDFLK